MHRILALLLTLSLSLPMGLACECDSLGRSRSLAEADLAFVGTCVYVETNWMSGGWKYSFAVEKSWKRQSDRLVVVSTGWERDCGYIFREGEKYLVFARKKFTNKTDRCLANEPVTPSFNAEALGPAFTPRSSSPIESRMRYLLLGSVLSGILFVLFVVLRKRLFSKGNTNDPSP